MSDSIASIASCLLIKSLILYHLSYLRHSRGKSLNIPLSTRHTLNIDICCNHKLHLRIHQYTYVLSTRLLVYLLYQLMDILVVYMNHLNLHLHHHATANMNTNYIHLLGNMQIYIPHRFLAFLFL